MPWFCVAILLRFALPQTLQEFMGGFAVNTQRSWKLQAAWKDMINVDILVIIQRFLPSSITFQSYLDTPKDHFLAALEVYTQLYYVTILYRKAWWFEPRLAQSYVVQKCSRWAFDILDVPLIVCESEFAMPSADYFWFEPYWSIRGNIRSDIGSSIFLGVTSYTNHCWVVR